MMFYLRKKNIKKIESDCVASLDYFEYGVDTARIVAKEREGKKAPDTKLIPFDGQLEKMLCILSVWGFSIQGILSAVRGIYPLPRCNAKSFE